MNIDAHRLQAFFTLSQTKHFAKASKRLGITQSALSQRIAKLEDELESTLFIRERSGIRLTANGLELLRYCQSLKHLEEDFLQELKQEKLIGGTIRIGGYSSVMRSLIVPALKPLLIDGHSYRFEFLSREMSELPDLLVTGEVDYIVLDHYLDKKDLEHLVIGEEEQVLIRAKLKNLQREVYLDHDEEDQTTKKFLSSQGEKNKRIERSFMDDIYGIIDGVKMGFGQAVVSKHLVEGDKELEVITSKKSYKNPIVLYYYQSSYYPKYHQLLIKALSSLVRK